MNSTIDSSGFSQIGRYGTVALVKRQDNAPVTAFGIDVDQLTFGRDPTCSVRLYYPDVSLVHCKIVFEERKAFLVVLGANGLTVDGCKVYPNASSSSHSTPTTIPLSNNSEFEIHGKRFRFTYPPKELRAALLATPARPTHRALRLSMIHSAQVFSPRPSHDPRENLRILKSPFKNTFKSGLSTPARTNLFAASEDEDEMEEEEEEDIVLVDGNHPRVVEDDKDLVILEDVEVQDHEYRAPHIHIQSPQLQQPPQTPARKRSLSRNTLHRAVLIRSAQRAVLKAESAEREREEEEEEEMEVLETVASEAGDESDEEHGAEDIPMESGSMEEDNAEDDEQSEEESGEEEAQPQTLTWRKSLERLWPFRSSSSGPNEDEHDAASEEEEGSEEDEIPAPLPPPQTPIKRPLGLFMTPQVHARSKVSELLQEQREDAQPSAGAGRYSLGGGEARRVIQTEQVWKVRDIVVPPVGTPGSNRAGRAFVGPGVPGAGSHVTASPMRTVVNEEERKAIKERRRSALREVGTFFPGGVPGLQPLSWSPTKGSSTSLSSATSSTSSGSSPFKRMSPSKSATSVKREDGEDDEEIDTRSLLERMKETVEGMKQRRSLAPGGTPARADASASPVRGERVSFGQGVRPTSPSKAAAVMMHVDEEEDEEIDDKENMQENRTEEDAGFSLLRPGVMEEFRATEGNAVSTQEEDDVVMDTVEDEHRTVDVPVDEVLAGDEEKSEDAPTKNGHTRAPKQAETDEEEDHDKIKSKSKVPARRTRLPTKSKSVAETGDGESAPAPVARRGRKPRVETNIEEEKEVPPAPVLTRKGRKAPTVEPEEPVVAAPPPRRGRKAAAEVDEDAPQENVVPVRKGRKPAAAALDETEELAETPAPAKRPTKKATPVVEEPEPVVRRGRTPRVGPAAAAPRKAAAKTKNDEETQASGSGSGGARRGTRTKPIEVEEEADPLDSIEMEEAAIAKPKGRKRAVKKEVVEDDAETAVAPATRIPRTKAMGTAVKTPATKSRTTKKVPVTAPAAIPQGVDKENTPGSDGSSIVDTEEPVKIRVSRTTRKAASGTGARGAKVKQEVSEDEAVVEPEAPRGRVMRATTRARTRT